MSWASRWIGRAIRRELRRFDQEAGISQIARLQLQQTLLSSPRFQDPRRLLQHEHQVFSQGGEDGIIREIFRRLGTTDRRFVEFGVGDGLENNSVFLLQQGWTGAWVDGDAKAARTIRRKFAAACARSELRFTHAFVTTGNAVELVPTWARDGASFDLLCIDLDRNTLAIWRSLATLRPRVAVIEYNAVWPADFSYEVAYAAERTWNRSSHFGASLKALELHARSVGYDLVGCDMAGTNAFFVRSDLTADRFAAPFTAENHYEPIRYGLHAKSGHPRDIEVD